MVLAPILCRGVGAEGMLTKRVVFSGENFYMRLMLDKFAVDYGLT